MYTNIENATNKGVSRWQMAKNSFFNFLRRGDEFVTGQGKDNYARLNQKGGQEFTSKNGGVAHSNYVAKYPDGRSSNIDELLRLTGNLYTPGFNFLHPGLESIVNITSGIDDLHGAYHNGGGSEFKPMGSGTKRDKFSIHVISSNSVSSMYDKDTDTSGMDAAMDSTLNSIGNR